MRIPLPSSLFVIRQGDAVRKLNALRALDMRLEQGDVQVTIETYEPKRSSAQHATFWAWCKVVAEWVRAAGQPCCEDAAHDWILERVYGVEQLGFGKTRPRKTLTRPHRLGKLAMIELLTRFEAEAAAELSLQLPRPATWDEDLKLLDKERARMRAIAA